MKLTEQEIIAAARQLRDEDNQKQHIRPWRKRHVHVPQWLVAIPAAALLGFIFGMTLGKSTSNEPVLTARIDTVYIQSSSPSPKIDETNQSSTTETPPQRRQRGDLINQQPMPNNRHLPSGKTAGNSQHSTPNTQPTDTTENEGLPISQDRIPYEMLVMR